MDEFRYGNMKKFILKISFFIALFGLMSDCFAKDSLVIYFSRTGDQYKVGNITEGNTAIVAKISSNINHTKTFTKDRFGGLLLWIYIS